MIYFFSILIFFSSIGVAMSPHRPDLMIFRSPKSDFELHSPIGKNSFLIKKSLLKNSKTLWSDSMNVELVFSDPSSARIITLGGLGDSGSDLGVIVFYDLAGQKASLQVQDVVPNLEELSSSASLFSNFPWMSVIDITDQELLIWVCDKVLIKVPFKTLKLEVVQTDSEPLWATKNKAKGLTPNAQRLQWKLKN
jgi:hypothetical protein